MRRLAAAASAVLLTFPVFAAEPAPSDAGRRLKELESALQQGQVEQEQIRRKAAALGAEVDVIRNDMVRSAQAIQEHEESLSALELQLHDLADIEAQKSAALELKRQQMNGVLTALQRLAFRPGEALIAQPAAPADTVRSAILLRTLVPKIKERAAELRGDLESLAALRLDIAREKRKITGASVSLDTENRRLAGLYQQKAMLQQATEAEQRDSEKRLAAMAAEAEDLRDLMARLELERQRQIEQARERAAAEKAAHEAQVVAERQAKEAALAAETARQAALVAEAKAQQQRQAAELAAAREAQAAQAEAERAAREAKIRADQAGRQAARAARETAEDQRQAAQRANRPFSRAQGLMPFPARGPISVRFGQMTDAGAPSKGIVIETRPAAQVVTPYDGQVVFAGPFRGYGLLLIIEHGEGYHTLLAGMDRIDSNVGQRLLAGEPVGVMAQSDGKPLLYIELRHNGQPVNPLSWLTTSKTKVSG